VIAAVTTVLVTLGLAVTGATQAAAVAADTSIDYVALGDSYAAGPLIPPQGGNPPGCYRSGHNYPAELAGKLGITEFTDVTCSGAVTDDLRAPQAVPFGTNPPQLDALRQDTDLVTLTIGGNDIGFADIVLECARLSARDPLGDPCQRQSTAGGRDVLAERIAATAPKIATALRDIRQKSPDAVVELVGYLRILPPANGCWPVVPISRGDVPYLDGVQQKLTAMLASQAQANGALFVDTYAASLGHDACQPPAAKWVEGVFPTHPAYPVHPNATGMKVVAGLALKQLTEASA
jgi:lysophospholipase L1-like esterase